MKDLMELLNKIDVKIDARHDALEQRMDALEVKAEVNNVKLDEHMLRTRIAEENIALIRGDLVPLQRTNTLLTFTIRSIPWMLGIGSVIIALLEYLKR